MINWKKPSLLAFAMLFILSAPALRSLANEGFYTSHDGETHTARIAQYYNAILDGQYPPRFSGSFYNGLGSPIFVYIYPLPYVFGSLWHFFGFSYADSFKLTMALAFLSSGAFCFLWLKALFKNDKAAFAGALFYTWVPYRFSLMYVRASISEMIAYAFVPACFYAITKFFETKSKIWVPVIALFVSMVLLSQSLVAMLTLPLLAVYALILSVFSKSKKGLIATGFAFILSLALGAITYMPTFFERDFVRFDDILRKAYANHFVSFWQLIRSPWGYGFDFPGVANDQMSFQLGLAQILVTLIVLLIIFVGALPAMKKTKILRKLERREFYLTVFFILVTTASIFLMLDTKITFEAWQRLTPLEIIDIPWRLIGPITIATAFFAALVVKTFNSKVLLVFLTLLVLYSNRNHLRVNLPRALDDDYFQNYGGSATQYNEFTPRWRQTEKVPEYIDPKQKYEVTKGDVQLDVQSSNSRELEVVADVKSQIAEVVFYKFYFPGMEVLLDGRRVNGKEEFEITDTRSVSTDVDKSGLPKLQIPKGQHRISLAYHETNTRKTANYISAFALLFTILLFVYYAKTH